MTRLEKARIQASNICIDIFENNESVPLGFAQVWQVGQKLSELVEQERIDESNRNK